jgi:hypothetical protein
MCPEELANESVKGLVGSSHESEVVDKDLVDINRFDVVQNLLKYQEETRKWRNKKVSPSIAIRTYNMVLWFLLQQWYNVT